MIKTRELFAGLIILLFFSLSAEAQSLTLADVQQVIAQAVSKAMSMNQRVTVTVVDKEGNHLATFAMTNTRATTTVEGTPGQGLEGVTVPASFASRSKAGTAGIFSTSGNAFTTRTAGFIIQEHFPPGIDNRPGGPLYGVQFSTLLCSDVAISGTPLGLSGDPGGVPLYKSGQAVGAVGVEGDGAYTVDRMPADDDQSDEEIIAFAASIGFESPVLIRGDNILVEGIRFPFGNVPNPAGATLIPFGSLPGALVPVPPNPLIRAAPPTDFIPATLNGVSGQMSARFPVIAGSNLTANEVREILGAAAGVANRVRAGIRQPLGSNARVNISVVDTDGRVLGIFRQLDAPVFGLDVSVQKARTTNFLSRTDAAAKLRNAGFGSYITRAAADGISLNGSVAFSDRGFGFLHRPSFPDGINGTRAGPFSSEIEEWSPFNVGLQLDLVTRAILGLPMVCNTAARAKQGPMPPCLCTAIPELKNGIQIFAGGLPIYRGSTHVGAIGISGDGIDQDDIIASGGANIFPPPESIRSDRVFVRGVRLPFLKFPARPFLD